MATLTAPQRLTIFAAIMRWWSSLREPVAFNKADLQAAVDATDTWIDDNAASFNSALPVAFRTGATLQQKTMLFCYVAMKRAGLTTQGE